MKDPLEYKIKGKECKSYKIDELKAMLKKKGEKVGGNKSELCARLKESMKRKKTNAPTVSKAKKNKVSQNTSLPKSYAKPSRQNSEFLFYGSLYYQMPGSKMAKEFLEKKYGFKQNYLNQFKNFKALCSRLSTR